MWRVASPGGILTPLGWTHGFTSVAVAPPAGAYPSSAPPACGPARDRSTVQYF